MNIQDIIDLYWEEADENGREATKRTELILWDGESRIELVVEGIDYEYGKAGAIVLVGKGWTFEEKDTYPSAIQVKRLNLAQKLDNRMNEHDQEAETP